VASSSDAGPSGVKDIDVLLGAEELVLIIDDTVGVWPKHRDNLVQIERYVYFPGCAVTFGRPGTALMERGLDEDESNGALTTCLRVLTEVHRRFFAELDDEKCSDNKEALVDVRHHLRALRRTILEGCCVLFTRVIPRNWRDPSEHPMWQLATALGARCTAEQSAEVTHVVAGDATDKTHWAHASGKYVVSVEWLICCGFTWQHAEESKFPIQSNGAAAAQTHFLGDDDVAAALKAAGGGISNKNNDA
jgi:RNA polymerase II C-terminal domain phosphatase-like 3/4